MTIAPKEVASAIGITISLLTPTMGSKYTSAGTIIRPPPMPNKPAKKPTTLPKATQEINTVKIILLSGKPAPKYYYTEKTRE